MTPSATGVLSKNPFAHLLMYCFDKKVTGSLVLHTSKESALESNDSIYFEAGYPSKIRIVEPIERLGEILREVGIIDDETFHQSLALLAQNQGLQGQILIRLGKLNENTLTTGLRLQIVRKLGHLFHRSPETTYSYYNAVHVLERYGGPETYRVDPRPVIWAGICSNPSLPHVRDMLHRVAHTPLHLRADLDPASLNLTAHEQNIWDQLRVSSVTPEELMHTLPIESSTIQRVLYALLLLKQIEVLSRSSRTSFSSISKQASSIEKGDEAPVSSPKPWASVGTVRLRKPHTESEPMPSSQRNGPSSTSMSIEDQRHMIQQAVEHLSKKNFFERLDLTQDASEADIKSAYFKLVKIWHPDRLPIELADVRESVARVFSSMTEAFQILSDPERRLEYKATLTHKKVSEEEQIHTALEAANAFAKAEFFLSKNMFTEAESYMQKAIKLEPKDPNHIAVWCWLQSMKPEYQLPSQLNGLIQQLNVAINQSSQCERAHLYRGMLLKKQEKIDEAIADFQCVLQTNPKHIEALREVRLHTMRKEKNSPLSRLFKKSHHDS